MTPTVMTPTESDEQILLMAWSQLQATRYPDLAWLYAIPNGGHRHKATAGRMKAEGVRAGYPDIGLDVARGGYHGLRVELKRRGAPPSAVKAHQRAWHDRLRSEGYAVHVALGWEAARSAILTYLEGGSP